MHERVATTRLPATKPCRTTRDRRRRSRSPRRETELPRDGGSVGHRLPGRAEASRSSTARRSRWRAGGRPRRLVRPPAGRLAPERRRAGHVVVREEGVRRLLGEDAVPGHRDRDGIAPTAASSSGSRTRGPRWNGRRAAAARSAARTSPAWVAIYCGQEIQIYDGDTGEPQKTGSIYNFDPIALDDAGADAEGPVERLRDPGRRPALHDHPQRRGDQRVRQHAAAAVVAGR